MAKAKEKKPLDKKGYVGLFNLIGEANVGDYTFKIDEKSSKSDWTYNQLSLSINCGDECGNCSAQLMGGYASERSNVIYVHGKKDDGSDDFSNQYTIDWDDRDDESILKDIGELCFITIGIEKDSKGKTFYKKFLSAYDAIAYVQEHLVDGMVVNVKGNLKYQMYNGSVTCQKNITSIALSNATPDKYRASFTQSMLIDKDSATKDNIDKDNSCLYVDSYVLEKMKEYNGWDLTEGNKNKGGLVVPLRKRFEYKLDLTKTELTAKLLSKIFKVKKGYDLVTFDGIFVESGATVTTTIDDLPDDIKELIELGMYTEEEAIAKCSANGNKERKMVLTKISVKLVDEDDNKVPTIQRVENVYDDADLDLYYLVPKDEGSDDEEEDDSDSFDDSGADSSDDDDLAALLDALN